MKKKKIILKLICDQPSYFWQHHKTELNTSLINRSNYLYDKKWFASCMLFSPNLFFCLLFLMFNKLLNFSSLSCVLVLVYQGMGLLGGNLSPPSSGLSHQGMDPSQSGGDKYSPTFPAATRVGYNHSKCAFT